jgi:hypothetical protein
MFLRANVIHAFEFYKCIIDASNGLLDRFWIKLELESQRATTARKVEYCKVG